ncbi:hypothetical protein PFISCL1PPCAC_15031, partial [Pristionchus fissidentatus]
MWSQSGGGPSAAAAAAAAPSAAVPMQSPAFANQFALMSPSFQQRQTMMGAARAAPMGAAAGMQPMGMFPSSMMHSFPPQGMAGGGMAPSIPMMSVPLPSPVVAPPTTKKSQAAAAAAAAASQPSIPIIPHNQQAMPPLRQVMCDASRNLLFVFMNGVLVPSHPHYNHVYSGYHQHQRMMQQQQAMQQHQTRMQAAAAAAAA